MQFYVVRHPGVMHTETRVSNTTTPGCRTARDPGVIHIFFATKLDYYRKKTN